MKGLQKATWVAMLLCLGPGLIHCELDYILPGGPPPTSTSTIVLTNPGKPLRAPTILSQASSHQKPRTKIVESYISSEFTVFGGGPRIPRPPPQRHLRYRLHHPNSVPRGQPRKPFEVVRAPVIYHQTVTDTDVTKALADAFDVVEKLRKPGNKPKALPQDDSSITHNNNVEFLNRVLSQNGRGNTATTTTTIVEAPQQLDLDQQRSHYHQSPAVTLGQVTLVSPEDGQGPADADISPPPFAIATSASVDETNAGVVPVLPATTTSTSPASSPKLIIPSQPHITTLDEAVQSMNPQIRTIIQPIYIPYPVDQNGKPIGPLPDYQSMDFGAILSAQTHILAAMRGPAPTIQLVEASQQPELQFHQQRQYYIQSDQSVANADVSSSGSVPSTSPSKSRKRIPIARRRNSGARRI